VAIKHGTFKEQTLSDLLESTERQLDKFCQQYQKRNVRWLQKEKIGNLI
jgi:hypothetical protein